MFPQYLVFCKAICISHVHQQRDWHAGEVHLCGLMSAESVETDQGSSDHGCSGTSLLHAIIVASSWTSQVVCFICELNSSRLLRTSIQPPSPVFANIMVGLFLPIVNLSSLSLSVCVSLRRLFKPSPSSLAQPVPQEPIAHQSLLPWTAHSHGSWPTE